TPRHRGRTGAASCTPPRRAPRSRTPDATERPTTTRRTRTQRVSNRTSRQRSAARPTRGQARAVAAGSATWRQVRSLRLEAGSGANGDPPRVERLAGGFVDDDRIDHVARLPV